jgi:mRNA interferase MazF
MSDFVRKIKDFVAWCGLKQRLDTNEKSVPFVSERDVWWVALGENIGSEIGGKSRYFSRPAVIVKKLTHGFYLIAPTTSQKKEGSWYVPISLNKKEMYVCLHQIRTIDYRRLYDRMGKLDEDEYARVKKDFTSLYLTS